MNTLQAARRFRDLEFASFYSLCRVLIDSDKFFQAQSVIPSLAISLNIPDNIAFSILDHCLQQKKLDTTQEFSENFEKLDEILALNQITQEEESSSQANSQPTSVLEVSNQIFQDFLGDRNAWVQFQQLLENGGERHQFEQLRNDLIQAAAKLRQQVARE